MKLKIFLVLALFTAIFADAKDYEVNVGEFSKIKVTDSINVVYKCVSADGKGGLRSGTAKFAAPARLADAFMFTNKNGQLRVEIGTEYVNDPELPVLYLYSDYMVNVENGGVGEIIVENPAPCADFKAQVIGNGSIVVKNLRAGQCNATIDTGSGSIVINGKVKKSVFRIIGTGLIQADRLESSEVVCKIMGAGSIGCWPIDALSVSGIGSTKIYYKGDPLKIKKRGGGNLVKME